MDIKKIGLVLGREFSVRVKKKSFIITTLVVPILFAALCIVPSLIMLWNTDDTVRTIQVLDRSGIVADKLESTSNIVFETAPEGADLEALTADIENAGVYAVLEVSPLDSANNLSLTAYSKTQINANVTESIKSQVDDIVEKRKLQEYQLENFDEILRDLNTKVGMETYILDADGEAKKAMLGVNMAISFILGIVIYMFVTMFGQMVMSSVVQEKSNKIVEVLVSSVKPFELMTGKVLGVACVALTQFVIWIVFTGILIVGFGALGGMDLLSSPETTEQMMAASGMDMGQVTDMMQDGAATSEIQEIINTVKTIDFGYILGCFLLYFVFGYLLYASLFAAIGSAVDNEADTNQLLIPITIPLLIGFLIAIQAFKNPDSSLSFWGSIIPFTSPMVMLARIPFEGGVPLWELLLSLGLLIATFVGVVFISAKIYRVGILMSGTKYTWKDLWKWLKY